MKIWFRLTTLVAVLVLIGCGGGDSGDTAAATDDGSTPGVETPAAGNAADAQAGGADSDAGAPSGTPTYTTDHDPDAVYTIDDVPNRMNYMKVNFEGMDPEVLNRVIHRVRTAKCTCSGCGGLTVDECLATRGECSVGMAMARDIILEEKAKAGS